METIKKSAEKFSRSVTWKAVVTAIISLFLLIPGAMISDLIRERKNRSEEAIANINNLWSNDQTITGPILVIPYETIIQEEKNIRTIRKNLNVTPEKLDIKATLIPKEKYYGIYKSVLYESELSVTGSFAAVDFKKIPATRILWDEAYVRIGISDLRGISNIPDFIMGNQKLIAEAGGSDGDKIGAGLIISAVMTPETGAKNNAFECVLKLKGSNSINFVPVGRTTKVQVNGNWNAPGFIGKFSPEHEITEKDFRANWEVLHFNRNIPEQWTNNEVENLQTTAFGIRLVDMVNHYQQTERASKYAIMFIALTFVVFFFVEILTGKRIHPIQYILVGFGLILFYSLLLSISEQTGFGIAYLIASIAIIGLISIFAGSIFKNKKQTGMLALILAGLYGYLYVVIQIEDIALLIGSIGLFIILSVIMYVSTKIKWYQPTQD
jgi:inner membrane protein